MRADRRFDLVQALVDRSDLVAVECPVAALALEHIQLPCVGIKRKAVQMRFAARN